MSKQLIEKPAPPPLPVTADAWQRFIKTQRTLNDEVEELHNGLLRHEDDDRRIRYQDLLSAVWPDHAIEGSTYADDLIAAQMIREEAVAKGSTVAKEKLATIAKALNVVLRRYHQSRAERRSMVAGQILNTDGSNNE